MGNRSCLVAFLMMSFLGLTANAGPECSSSNMNKSTDPTYLNRCSAENRAAKKAKEDAAKNTQPKQSSSVVGGDCESGVEIPFSQLSYVGNNLKQKLTKEHGSCLKVAANDDAEARKVCPGYLLNPGNPQYTGKRSYGDLSSNVLGYYFCIRGPVNFNKKKMCDDLKKDGLTTEFVYKNKTDGNCICGAVGSTQKEDCDQGIPSSVTAEAKKIENSDGKPVGDSPPAVATEPSEEMKNCVVDPIKDAEACLADANRAAESCDKDNQTNPEYTQLIQAPKKISDGFIRANQNSGKATECLLAGAVSSGSSEIAKLMKDRCDAESGSCKSTCGTDKIGELSKKCFDKIPAEEIAKKEGPNLKFFRESIEKVTANINEGTPICDKKVPEKASGLETFMNQLGNSLNSAMRCSCQLAASTLGQGSKGCNSLPDAAYCAANPGAPDCVVFSAIDICTLGSPNYSAVGCKCQDDPKAQGCAGFVAQNAGNSGFAGPDVKLPVGGASFSPGGTTAGSGGGGENVDLSGLKADDAAAVAKSKADGPGFLSGSGGGGGGGAASPGGGGGESALNGESESEAKSLGLFGSVKSTLSNLFGKGSNGNSGAGVARTSVGDPNRFRPTNIRGLAGSNGFGTKNSNIWEAMNLQYDSINSTFETAP